METREFYFIENHFREFFDALNVEVQDKVIWTLKMLQALDRIPENYLKHLSGTKGLYEIRVQYASRSFRIFCFFDNKILVIGHGFEKKTQKTPRQEIRRAEKLKKEYYEKNAPGKP